MERYLLFDSGCSLCSNLAQSVQAESNGLLMARSLREPAIQAILNEVKPGWKWEPMLLEVNGQEVRVFTGIGMKLQLVTRIGARATWDLVQIMTKQHEHRVSSDRRNFIGRVAGALTMSALASIFTYRKILAQDDNLNSVYLPLIATGTKPPSQEKYRVQPVTIAEDVQEAIDRIVDTDLIELLKYRLSRHDPSLEGQSVQVLNLLHTSDGSMAGTGVIEPIYGLDKYGMLITVEANEQIQTSAILFQLNMDKQELIATSWSLNVTPVGAESADSFNPRSIPIVESTHSVPLDNLLSEEQLSAASHDSWFTCEWFCGLMCSVGWGVMCALVCPPLYPIGGVPGMLCTMACIYGSYITCQQCGAYCNWLCKSGVPGC